jgi:two-component system, LytTR family, sensor kinase
VLPSLRPLVLLVVGSTLVGLYFASQAAMTMTYGGSISWTKALSVNLTYYYCWGLAVPVILWVTRRFPFTETRWRSAVGGHLLACLAIGAAVTVVAEVVLKYGLNARPGSLSELIVYGMGVNLHSTLPTYWMVVIAGAAFDFYARLRDREVRASQLEASLSDARLTALRTQLRPHFLFNSLNSISTLIHEEPQAANAMLARLSDFLRATLHADSRQMVPLRDELDFVAQYLEIEKVRLQDRLRVVYDIDADVLDTSVPTLILQPIVENAIYHAISPRVEGGTIIISAATDHSGLRLRIQDDGPGMTEATGARIGLQNTRARLLQLYGGGSRLDLQAGSPTGLVVVLSIPPSPPVHHACPIAS